MILFCVCAFSISAYPAPLLDDVPSDHWAHDAVANLASNGVMEGYSDGFFKGDRALTRYEMATVVARLLAKNDREHAVFATKAGMEDMKKLSTLLEDELKALGVNMNGLEESLKHLKMRLNNK